MHNLFIVVVLYLSYFVISTQKSRNTKTVDNNDDDDAETGQNDVETTKGRCGLLYQLLQVPKLIIKLYKHD
jgi:hypothetical protein